MHCAKASPPAALSAGASLSAAGAAAAVEPSAPSSAVSGLPWSLLLSAAAISSACVGELNDAKGMQRCRRNSTCIT